VLFPFSQYLFGFTDSNIGAIFPFFGIDGNSYLVSTFTALVRWRGHIERVHSDFIFFAKGKGVKLSHIYIERPTNFSVWDKQHVFPRTIQVDHHNQQPAKQYDQQEGG